MKIAKLKTGGYAVIDTLWGINFKFFATTQKECKQWCISQGIPFTTGHTY